MTFGIFCICERGTRHRAAPQRQSKVSDPGKQNGLWATHTEHGKLQAAQPESGRSMKAKAQRESRRRQGNGWFRSEQITQATPGMAGVVTAQRSVTSADGFSVQPTTKLDGDQRIQ